MASKLGIGGERKNVGVAISSNGACLKELGRINRRKSVKENNEMLVKIVGNARDKSIRRDTGTTKDRGGETTRWPELNWNWKDWTSRIFGTAERIMIRTPE
jgi:hypothetical protein